MEDGVIPELTEWFKEIGSAVICYSGGLDSTVLLRNAIESIPDTVVAVYAELPMTSKRQKDVAVENALALGIQPNEVRVWWDSLGDVKSNGPDRCYHCKKGIYGRAKKIADNLGYPVISGDNADDDNDSRPGHKAGLEIGVLCPLQELGIGRAVIEEAVSQMGLPKKIYKDTCLATRYPAGERLTDSMLRYVEGCESIVRTVSDVGLLRVRLDSDNNALIQVDPSEISKVQRHLKEIESSFILKGIEDVKVDENGYKSVTRDG